MSVPARNPGEEAASQAAALAERPDRASGMGQSPLAGPYWRLSAVHRGTPFEPVTLSPGRYTLGADPQCDLRLNVEGIAPRHCLLMIGADRTIIKAWAPQTWVNDGIITEGLLRPGDRLVVGPVELRFEQVAAPALPDQHALALQIRELQDAARQVDQSRQSRVREQQLNDLLDEVRGQLDDVLRRERDAEHGLSRQRLALQHRAQELAQQQAELDQRRADVPVAVAPSVIPPDLDELIRREQELADRARELAVRNRALRSVQVEVEQLDQRRAAAEQAEAVARNLQARHDAQQRQIERGEASLLSQQEALQDRASDLQRRSSANDDARRKFESEQKSWEGTKRHRESLLNDLEESLGRRLRELDEEATRLGDWQTRLSAERREINDLRFAHEESEVRSRAARNEDAIQVERLREQLQQSQDKLRDEQLQLSSVRKELVEQQTELDQRVAERNRLEAELQTEQANGRAELDRLKQQELAQQAALDAERSSTLLREQELADLTSQLQQAREELARQQGDLNARDALLSEQQVAAEASVQATEQAAQLAEAQAALNEAKAALEQVETEAALLRGQLANLGAGGAYLSSAPLGSEESPSAETIEKREQAIQEHDACLHEREVELRRQLNDLDERGDRLKTRETELDQFEQELRKVEAQLADRDIRLTERESLINLRADEVQQQFEELEVQRAVPVVAAAPAMAVETPADDERLLEAARLQALKSQLEMQSRQFDEERLQLDDLRTQLESDREALRLQTEAVERLRMELTLRDELANTPVVETPPEPIAAAPAPTATPVADGEGDYEAWKNSVLSRFGIDAKPADSKSGGASRAEKETPAAKPAGAELSSNPASLRSELAEMFGLQKPTGETRPLDDTASSDPELQVHPPSQDRMDRVLGAVAKPAAVEPARREAQAAPDADVEPSVASYMEGLLARSRGNSSAPMYAEPKPVAPPPPPAPVVTAPVDPVDETARKARKMKPEDKESLRADLDSFRELANQSARSAVAKSQVSRKQTNLKVVAGGATLAGVATVVFLSTELWMTEPQRIPALLAGITCIVLTVLVYLRYGEIRLLGHSRSDHAGHSESKDDSSDDKRSENPPAENSNPLSFL